MFGSIVEFCGDTHGSRLIQELIKKASSDDRDRVFQEIKDNAIALMKDVYGNYVIQMLFEYGTQMHKKALVMSMKGQIYELSVHIYGCRVIQKVGLSITAHAVPVPALYLYGISADAIHPRLSTPSFMSNKWHLLTS